MEDEKGTSAWHRVPTWDGSPAGWRSFKHEMSWWVQSLDLEQSMKYNLAARWLLRQSGVVRQRGEEFLPTELECKRAVTARDPETGAEVVISEADPLFGLNKLLDALESINGKSDLDKNGDLWHAFYNEMRRKPGEGISEYCTRFRTLAADMRSEGIAIPDPELGWFLREKLGFNALRKQLLETALAGRNSYNEVEREILRLFKDLHVSDPLHRKTFGGDGKASLMQRFLGSSSSSSGRPSTLAPSSSSSYQHRPFRSSVSVSSLSTYRYRSSKPSSTIGQPRQSFVTEADAPEEHAGEGENELIPADTAGDVNLEEVLQAESSQFGSRP